MEDSFPVHKHHTIKTLKRNRSKVPRILDLATGHFRSHSKPGKDSFVRSRSLYGLANEDEDSKAPATNWIPVGQTAARDFTVRVIVSLLRLYANMASVTSDTCT